MRPMSRATHGYLMTAAAISPTYVDQPRAITRTGRGRRPQPDINFEGNFPLFALHQLVPPLPLMHDTLVSSLRDSILALPHLLAELQCP
jgi:hypothetical protein